VVIYYSHQKLIEGLFKKYLLWDTKIFSQVSGRKYHDDLDHYGKYLA
jgi:hypothetical protein